MNRLTRGLFSASLLLLMYLPSTASATGCGSAAKVGSDIWGEYGIWLKSAGCSIAGIATANPEIMAPCMDAANKADEVLQDAIAFWNQQASGSWATIGPRALPANEWEEGTIVGTTGRVFVTTTPVPPGTEIIVKERGGKGKTEFAVCEIRKDGKQNKLRDFTFNAKKAGKDNESQERRFTYNGRGDVVVVVHFDGKSVANKFQYEIKAKTN